MSCKHDLAEMDTAAHWDGLCPLCLQAEIERLTKELEAQYDHNADLDREIERLRAVLERIGNTTLAGTIVIARDIARESLGANEQNAVKEK